VNFNDLAIHVFLRNAFLDLPVREDAVILDLGCGTQPYRALYLPYFGRVVRADYDVRDRIDVRADASQLPFKDEAFDLVLFSEVIEHVSRPDIVIAEIARILKPDGQLLITWPFIYMLHELPNDYTRIGEFGMRELLSRNGMKFDKIAVRGDAVVVLVVLMEFLASGLFESIARILRLRRVSTFVTRYVLRPFFNWFYRLHIAVFRQRYVGTKGSEHTSLIGISGHLAHWPLGYCAKAVKRGGS